MASTSIDTRTREAATEAVDAAVVGAGPAGIAAARALRDRGVRAIVLERETVGAAWRARYDRLRLNTSRFTSRLPGERYAPGTGIFPSRDAFVTYLECAAANLDIRPGVDVIGVERESAGWRLRTSTGSLRAGAVIVATGYAREPFVPSWPGRDRFQGRFLHSAAYMNAEPFRGADVLVAGPGSSGMEIAYELATEGARRVRLAVRTPPNIVLRAPLGDSAGIALSHLPPRLADGVARVMRRAMLGDLASIGLPTPDEGTFARLRRLGVAPAIIDPEVLTAIKDGRIQIVSGVTGFDAAGVRLDNGSRAEPDAVIAATGFRCGLEPLVGQLGVLDDRGVPRASEPEPGLHFVGFQPVPGQIRRMGIEARSAARAIARSRWDR